MHDDKDCMTLTHSLFDPQHLVQCLAHRYLLNMHVRTYVRRYVYLMITTYLNVNVQQITNTLKFDSHEDPPYNKDLGVPIEKRKLILENELDHINKRK